MTSSHRLQLKHLHLFSFDVYGDFGPFPQKCIHEVRHWCWKRTHSFSSITVCVCINHRIVKIGIRKINSLNRKMPILTHIFGLKVFVLGWGDFSVIPKHFFASRVMWPTARCYYIQKQRRQQEVVWGWRFVWFFWTMKSWLLQSITNISS